MTYLTLIVPLVTAGGFLLGALLLVWDQRAHAQARWRVTLFNSLFGASLFLASLDILLFWPSISHWEATTSVMLCTLIFRARGRMVMLLEPYDER